MSSSIARPAPREAADEPSEQFLTSSGSPLSHPSLEDSLEHTVRRIRAALLLR
jgi:hypothetical protein